MTNIKPLGSLILIKEQEEKDKTLKSGLVIAATSLDPVLKRGTVVATGPGDYHSSGDLHSIPLQVGDVVIYSPNHATEIEDLNGTKYHFINWRQLFGVENNEQN
jgi:co-chaperonin GroES (HSP10)